MMERNYPDPNNPYPISGVTRTGFLKNFIKNPQIKVGDYTYYDDPEGPEAFEKNVLYLFDFIGDKLIIGKFCQIATGVTFIMNGANHSTEGFSTYPFKVFGQSWSEAHLKTIFKGNTIIGNDVWIGYKATIMPGVKVGDGAIIAAESLVTKDIEPYTIVGGNPAKEIRKRFDPEIIDLLVKLQWWNWEPEKITQNLDFLTAGDINHLKKL
jgi:virginiamycin A acetyltransferase